MSPEEKEADRIRRRALDEPYSRRSDRLDFDFWCLEFWVGLGAGLSCAAGVWSYVT